MEVAGTKLLPIAILVPILLGGTIAWPETSFFDHQLERHCLSFVYLVVYGFRMAAGTMVE